MEFAADTEKEILLECLIKLDWNWANTKNDIVSE